VARSLNRKQDPRVALDVAELPTRRHVPAYDLVTVQADRRNSTAGYRHC
jgi:hypothetical protein